MKANAAYWLGLLPSPLMKSARSFLRRSTSRYAIGLEEFKQKMRQQGQTAWFLDAFIELSTAINRGGMSLITTTITDRTGKPPRSCVQFASDHAEQFAGPVPTGV